MAVVAVVVAYGALSAAVRFQAIARDWTIGRSDTAAYAEIGRSLAEGRGFYVRYVSTFYIPYPRTIDRPDDHWPPLMGMMIAPFFATLGVSAFNAKIPAVLMGAIGLPLAALALGIALSRSALVGLVAGLLMIVNHEIVAESLTTLADVTLAALLAGFLAALVAARERPRFYLLAGVLAALAYYAKLSELILLPLFPATALLVAGPRVLREPRMSAGVALAFAGVLPWLVSSWVHYGSPLHTTHNYASGFIGLTHWEQTHYRPFWGRDLPRTSDRWTEHAERYWPLTRRQREEYVRMALLGPGTGQADWYRFGPLGVAAFALLRGEDVYPALERTRPDTALAKPPLDRSLDPAASDRAAAGWRRRWAEGWRELGAALASGWQATLSFLVAEERSTIVPNLLGAAYAACVLIGVPLRAALRGTLRSDLARWPRSFGVVAGALLLGVAHGVLLIYFFTVAARFVLPAVPILAALGLTGVACVVRGVARPLDAAVARRVPGWRSARPYASGVAMVATCALLLLFAATHARELQAWQRQDASLEPRFRTTPAAHFGRWIARHLPPDAVIMTRHPWELRFYVPASVKTVALPWSDDPREILGIAWYYGVTHVVADGSRPVLDRYLAAGHPGVTRIDAPVPLYAIDWSALPAGHVRLPHQTSDPRTALNAGS